jgi:hypothetical protein
MIRLHFVYCQCNAICCCTCSLATGFIGAPIYRCFCSQPKSTKVRGESHGFHRADGKCTFSRTARPAVFSFRRNRVPGGSS